MTSLSTHMLLQGVQTDGDRSVEARALAAQGELLPYALAFFAIALPVFVWAGAYATNAAWMSAIFAQFGLNWTAFYAVVNLIARKGEDSLPVRRRTALHVGCGLLWALAVAEIAVFGANAGPVRDIILGIDTAAAVACIFFAAPCLPCLLVVAPAAAGATTSRQGRQGAAKKMQATAAAVSMPRMISRTGPALAPKTAISATASAQSSPHPTWSAVRRLTGRESSPLRAIRLTTA